MKPNVQLFCGKVTYGAVQHYRQHIITGYPQPEILHASIWCGIILLFYARKTLFSPICNARIQVKTKILEKMWCFAKTLSRKFQYAKHLARPGLSVC